VSPKEPQTTRGNVGFMRVKRRFAQSQSDVIRVPLRHSATETQKNRMNAGAFAVGRNRLHNFRVTRLCTGCTRLMNKKLQMHVFR
jgi:hypothetical protein